MPQERVELGPKHIALATEAAASGQYSQSNPLTLQDTRERNLQIRVQRSTATWIVRYNRKTLSLGPLTEIRTVTAARETAKTVVLMLKQGEDPRPYILERRKGIETAKALDVAAEKSARVPNGTWTWEELARAYVDNHLAQPRTNKQGITRQPSEKSVAAARRYLLLPAHDHLRDKRLDAIDAADIEVARDKAFTEISPTASKKVVDWASAALTWAKRFHKAKSGLANTPSWWKEVESTYHPPARTRHLSLDEIATLLKRVETHRVADGRRVQRETSESIICALWWLVLTAQRTGASMQLMRTHVVPDPDAEGWLIAAFPAENMKSRRYHALPIPPRVALLFRRIQDSSDRSSQWVFPSRIAVSRKTGQADDLHVSDNAVGQMIARLRGRRSMPAAKFEDQPQAKAPAKTLSRDLLAGIPEFSPHDLRRSLTTILMNLKVRGDAISAILDHAQPVPGAQSFAEAPVTRLVYDLSDKLALKREAMEIWTNSVFAACDKAWGPGRLPKIPGITDRRPAYSVRPWYRALEEQDRKEKSTQRPSRVDWRLLLKAPHADHLRNDFHDEQEG